MAINKKNNAGPTKLIQSNKQPRAEIRISLCTIANSEIPNTKKSEISENVKTEKPKFPKFRKTRKPKTEISENPKTENRIYRKKPKSYTEKYTEK